MCAADLFIQLRAWLTREGVVAGWPDVAEVGHDRARRRDERGVDVAERSADPGWRDRAARYEVAVGVHGEAHHEDLSEHHEHARGAAEGAACRLPLGGGDDVARLGRVEVDLAPRRLDDRLAHRHVRLGASVAQRAVGERVGAHRVTQLLQHVELGPLVFAAGAGRDGGAVVEKARVPREKRADHVHVRVGRQCLDLCHQRLERVSVGVLGVTLGVVGLGVRLGVRLGVGAVGARRLRVLHDLVHVLLHVVAHAEPIVRDGAHEDGGRVEPVALLHGEPERLDAARALLQRPEVEAELLVVVRRLDGGYDRQAPRADPYARGHAVDRVVADCRDDEDGCGKRGVDLRRGRGLHADGG